MRRLQHRRFSKAIDAWVDLELDDARSDSVAAHLQVCWDCSSAAETTLLIKQALQGLGDHGPPLIAAARLRRFADQLVER